MNVVDAHMFRNPNVIALLAALVGADEADFLLTTLHMPASLAEFEHDGVTRAELAHAMNLALFSGLIARSPNTRAYLADVRARGDAVFFDHGALRTVLWAANGALPPGEAAFTRILRPLGYRLNGRYPLDRLNMIGRAYVHEDAPDEIAQFFVSELFPEMFSERFQAAVTKVVSHSTDPLTPLAVAQLHQLERDGVLPMAIAQSLLPVIVAAFERQHPEPDLADYETLLAESAEMAWIATEGNAFNHATDRVSDVFTLADAEKRKGRPIKPDIERSRSGRVFQTAYRADMVERRFRTASGETVTRMVPGSFYEFITRKREFNQTTRTWVTDLRFDAGNAQGIFKMTGQAPAAQVQATTGAD
jgi:hypothetical protein